MSEGISNNFEPRISPPKPRTLELSGKKEREGLTPEEEGELRGLFAHPDNPEAASLLQKEYLTSQGMGQMSDEERERLRIIRMEKYRREHKEELSQDTPPKPDEAKQAEASAAELSMLHTQAKIASLEGRWDGLPKEVIDRMIQAIPEDVIVYTKETLHLVPKDEPSEMELYFLSKIQNLSDFRKDDKPEGALRIMESIRCLRDKIRTKKFLVGLTETLNNIDSSEKSEIEICDAGTGAIPILAIYAALSSEKVRCTAIELNPNSAAIARQVIEAFGLQDRIKILQTDATKFESEKQFDLLISETMHSGLTAEPMVQIFSNLKKYLKEGGAVLPSAVKVRVALVPLQDWTSPKGFVKIYGNLHHVVSPDWKEVVNYKPGDDLKEIAFDVPVEDVPKGSYFVLVTSEVDIGSQQIDSYQSLITMPQFLRDAKSNPAIFDVKTGDRHNTINVKYKPGEMLDGVSKFN